MDGFIEMLIWRLAMHLKEDSRMLWIIDGNTSEECAGEFWAAIAPRLEITSPWEMRQQVIWHVDFGCLDNIDLINTTKSYSQLPRHKF